MRRAVGGNVYQKQDPIRLETCRYLDVPIAGQSYDFLGKELKANGEGLAWR